MSVDLDTEEASALAETIIPEPVEMTPLFKRHVATPPSCDSLYLPPCPKCSWVETWRRPVLDRLEYPLFTEARHSTVRYGRRYYMLRGCSHATELGLRFGPVVNRLKVATAWRRVTAELRAILNPRMPAEPRAEFLRRLSHPSLTPN